MVSQPRILLGVTADSSLVLFGRFPEYLTERGWEVHLVSADGPNSKRLRADGNVTVHTVPMRRDLNLVGDMSALAAWIRILRKVRPQVVSVGTPKAALLGSVAALLLRVPVRIYLLRGLRQETLTGVKRLVSSAAEILTIMSTHRVLAVSHSLREVAIAEKVVRSDKIAVLGSGSSNGVDTRRFTTTHSASLEARRLRWPADPTVPVIGYVGRLHPDKGLSLLADAAAQLARQGTRARLLIIGPDDEASAGILKDRLLHCGLATELIGPVSDLSAYYPLIDILCLPTRREGFPNVVLEAAAAGVPTVATNATGIVDAIIHGETGIICGERSADSYAAAIKYLLDHPHIRQQYGRAANRRVTEVFASEIVWANLHNFYSEHLTNTKLSRD